MVDQTELMTMSITKALDIYGWSHLDSVLLAALATQSPLLLVGPHGTAKSLLVEKMAGALNLQMRHYNASLLNYDDLVGIPLPDEAGESLRFVPTPGSIWDAGFVFFDEISRCRADLQNKLFPIIHERKIVGIPLENLQHRWAAMNPPAPEEMDNSTGAEYYLGSEPLDPALADRFPFVVPVPNWRGLSAEDRRHLLAWHGENPSNDTDLFEHVTGQPLQHMIDECRSLIPEIEAEFSEWLTDYIMYVMDLLDQAKLAQSPRRARMLARSVSAIHAARMILEHVERDDLEFSAQLALIYGLPQSATDSPPSQATIIATHRQAWEIASLSDGDDWRQILEETDPIQRILLAEQLGFAEHDLGRLITQALATEESDARQCGLATAIFLTFKDRHSLTPSAWEPLAKLAREVLEPRQMTTSITPGYLTNTWNEITDWCNSRSIKDNRYEKMIQNFVLCGFPDRWKNYKWQDVVEQFRTDLAQFGIKEGEY
ncbi:MAG: MoxR family ATPase [Aggregatilineales bacterium]